LSYFFARQPTNLSGFVSGNLVTAACAATYAWAIV